VYHASTILFRDTADLRTRGPNRLDDVVYGRFGTPTTFAFEEAMADAEGGARSVAVGSGKTAVAVALSSFLAAGDHLLMVDSAYGPTRGLAGGWLARFGVETTFYDPCIGAGIAGQIRDNTRVVFLESPGSHTFEVQDVPGIAAAAHARDCTVILDNTWASPLFFRPFEHGVDVSIQAATKYVSGHSDVMLGAVTTTEETHVVVRKTAQALGATVGPDDLYLGLRGLRTLDVRLRRHMETGLALARWLADRPEVERVLHPGLEGDPGHALWRRDFLGASGLFGMILRPAPPAAYDAFLDGLELFGMGSSWGGFESLIVPSDPSAWRTATVWNPAGPLLRLHIGLEDPDDLIADLEAGFARLRAAG
jgi:cystathionine beta-lyase